MADQPMRCARCLQPASSRCARCKTFFYCSRACQLEHWSLHKPLCKRLAQTTAASPPANNTNNTDSNTNSTNSNSNNTNDPQPMHSMAMDFGSVTSCLSAPPDPSRKTANKSRHRALPIAELQVGQTHYGRYVEGAVASEPTRLNAVTFHLQDRSAAMMLAVYNYPGHQGPLQCTKVAQGGDPALQFKPPFRITRGQRVRVYDPFCKIALDGRTIIRVDDFSDFEILDKP